MKNKSLKAITALLLSSAMLLGACGSDGAAADNTPAASDQEQTAAAESKTPEAESGNAAASVSDITFPLEEPVTLDVFVYASNTGGGTFSDNYMTDYIEKETNVKLNFVYDVDGDEGKTKLNLVMSDPDNLPDIFLATGWTKSELTMYGQQGLIIPLNDYLADAPNWNRANEESPARKADITMSDGNIYCYGVESEVMHVVYQNRMWIYKPWVDKLCGGKMPETTEELYNYLVAVKTQDPNGNGIADEIPLSGRLGGWSTDPTVFIINSFLQCNNPLSNTNPTVGAGLVVKDGKITSAFTDERYKDAMVYLNKLYAEGLLDSQTFTQDETQFIAQLDNEPHLVGMHAGGMMQGDVTGLGVGPGAYQNWVALDPVEGPDGVRLAASGLISYFQNCRGVVSKNCEHPEIAVALFDWLMNDDPSRTQSNGPLGIGWDYLETPVEEDGVQKLWQSHSVDWDTFDWSQFGDGKAYESNHVVWAADAFINNSSAAKQQESYDPTPADVSLGKILNAAWTSYAEYKPDADSLVPDIAFDTEASKRISDFTLTIGSYVNQATVQFITGAVDIETEWPNYLDKMNNMGLEEYLAIYQQGYDEYMAASK